MGHTITTDYAKRFSGGLFHSLCYWFLKMVFLKSTFSFAIQNGKNMVRCRSHVIELINFKIIYQFILKVLQYCWQVNAAQFRKVCGPGLKSKSA